MKYWFKSRKEIIEDLKKDPSFCSFEIHFTMLFMFFYQNDSSEILKKFFILILVVVAIIFIFLIGRKVYIDFEKFGRSHDP